MDIIPWDEEKPDLPCNYDMALQRLENTEKRFMKNQEVRDSYSKAIAQYLEKGYISKINHHKEKSGEWYLTHFSVIRLDKSILFGFEWTTVNFIMLRKRSYKRLE